MSISNEVETAVGDSLHLADISILLSGSVGTVAIYIYLIL